MDSKIWMTASTCTEVPTVGWMCLKRTDATRPYSGYGYSGPASCLMDLVILLKRRMISEVLTLHCRWQSGLSRSGLRMNLLHNDTRVSIWSGISSKLHCSAVSLELDAAGVKHPCFLVQYVQVHPPPIPLYYLPPPSYYSTTTALFLTSSTSLLQTFATFRLLRLSYSYQSYLLHDIPYSASLADIEAILLLNSLTLITSYNQSILSTS